jgi:dUTP pyrophosphatase
MQVNLKFVDDKKLKQIPKYSTVGSAGMDVCSSEEIIIHPKSIALVKTNLSLEIPSGHEIQIRSRSGLAAKSGIFVLNAPGTIDSDYRGEIGVILYNISDKEFIIKPGDRIAQAVLSKYERAEIIIVESISKTERADGGFGSTGIE